MSLLQALSISGSGLTAERVRLDAIAANLANQDSLVGPAGQPYQRLVVLLATARDGGVKVAGIVRDPTPGPLVYDPRSPLANRAGYVRYPNVNPAQEMVDLLEATRAYQANVTAIEATKSDAQRLLSLLG